MARKKTYKGVVLEDFSVGYKDGTVTYHVGGKFETHSKDSLQHLINTKKIK